MICPPALPPHQLSIIFVMIIPCLGNHNVMSIVMTRQHMDVSMCPACDRVTMPFYIHLTIPYALHFVLCGMTKTLKDAL